MVAETKRGWSPTTKKRKKREEVAVVVVVVEVGRGGGGAVALTPPCSHASCVYTKTGQRNEERGRVSL